MSVKYISLALNMTAVVVLIAGVVGIATQAKSTTKRSLLPTSSSLPQIKVERLKEVSEMSLAMDAYERVGSIQKTELSTVQASASSSLVASGASESYKSIFVGIDSKIGSIAQGNPQGYAATPAYTVAKYPVRSVQTKTALAKDAPKINKLPAIDLPKVTVVAVSGQEPRAVINGNVVGVNDQLAGGYVVKQISIDSVVVSQGAEDILIKIPLERLRVLGAQEGVRSKGP